MDIYSVPDLTCRKCYDTIDRHRLISILKEGTDDTGFFNLIHKGWTLERGGRTQSERKASYRPYYVTSTSISRIAKIRLENETSESRENPEYKNMVDQNNLRWLGLDDEETPRR